jgi:hypothetical protein
MDPDRWAAPITPRTRSQLAEQARRSGAAPSPAARLAERVGRRIGAVGRQGFGRGDDERRCRAQPRYEDHERAPVE